MDQLVTQVVTDLVQLAIVALCTYLVALIRAHLTQSQINKAQSIAGIAVKAAEAIGYAQGFDSQAKFQQALATARVLAEKYGIKFTNEQWRGLLEQAVHEIKTLGDELHAKAAVNALPPS